MEWGETITLAQATAHCEAELKLSMIGQACLPVIGEDDMAILVEGCIEDIKVFKM